MSRFRKNGHRLTNSIVCSPGKTINKEPMKKTESAKIIFLSSIASLCNNLKLENLNKIDYEMDDDHRVLLYSNSKLCCILAAQEFGRRLEKYGITANSIDPISVRTKIFHNINELQGLVLTPLLNFGVTWFSQHPMVVAKSFLYVISKKGSDTNGKNFLLSSIGRKPRILKNKQLCEDVWSKMEDLVQLKPEEKISLKND